MLYIDGLMMKHLKNELNSVLAGRKIGKIYQYDNFSIALMFGKVNLSISINPELPIVYLSEVKEEGLSTPPNFCLVLRKFLSNGILTSIEQFENDRILILNFSTVNEIGSKNEYKLIVETMGKHSNLFLTDSSYKIIELLKRFSIEENRLRILIPGVFYKFPVIEKKESYLSVTESFFYSSINSFQDILTKIQGFGSYSAKEVYSSFNDFKLFINKTPKPTVYMENNKIKFASFVEFKEFENLEKVSFDTINSLIAFYVEKSINSRSFNQHKMKIEKVVTDEIKRIKNSMKFNNKDILKYSEYEKYKNIGDILAANLYAMKSGLSNITLFDFYTENEIVIALNPEKSPADNMKIYYDKFSKYKRGYNFNLEREMHLQEELDYFNSVQTFINTSSTLEELKNIESELAELKYIKKQPEKRGKKQSLPSILEFQYDNEIKIIAGKNNKANDYITMKLADRNDFWFHVKDIPGSHVIIKSPYIEPDETLIETAAKIAAFYSSAKENSGVSVDYTFRKYVKKPSGAKPGFVTYLNQKTIFVKPELPNMKNV